MIGLFVLLKARLQYKFSLPVMYCTTCSVRRTLSTTLRRTLSTTVRRTLSTTYVVQRSARCSVNIKFYIFTERLIIDKFSSSRYYI